MATFSAKTNKRSISLPCRSHPATKKMEEELNKLKTWESEISASPTAEAVYNGLLGLGKLHKCMGDLLTLPLTLSQQCQNKKWVDEILDNFLKFLDICGMTRDLVSQFKENVKDVQSSLRRRRRKGDLSMEAVICTNYYSFRKKMKKDAKSLITALKKMDHEEVVGVMEVDQLVSAVIRVLREVSTMGITVFQMVLVFLSAAQNSKAISRWSLVSRFVNPKGSEDNVNEIERADVALSSLFKCGVGASEVKKIQFVQNKLERVEAHFECIENGLDNIFRCLIRSRSTLLNVVSCQ